MDDKQFKIIIFSEDQDKVAMLDNFLRQQADIHASVEICSPRISTEEILLRYSPSLIFIDFDSMAQPDQETLISKLESISDMITLVGIFNEEQKMEALHYVKRGLRDIVELPFNDQEIIKVIHRFRKDINSAQYKKMGKVFTFFSFKGGVGNTFVSVNTAISLARTTKKKVLLWDMALQAGDIPFFLNYTPTYTLADILDNADHIDEAYLQGVLAPHTSGISILPAPTKIDQLDRLTPDNLERVLHIFMRHFDYIVIDGGYRLSDALIPLIDSSAYLFITCTLELISLRSASRCLDLLEQLNYSTEKIKIVVNRYNSKFESIPIEKAREILRYNLCQFISNDYQAVNQSVNLGQAIVDIAKGSTLDKQFREFAAKIEKNFSTEPANNKMLGKLSNVFKKASK
jgi:pilus assembly protein CpaE